VYPVRAGLSGRRTVSPIRPKPGVLPPVSGTSSAASSPSHIIARTPNDRYGAPFIDAYQVAIRAQIGGYLRAGGDQRRSLNVTGFSAGTAPDRRLGAPGSNALWVRTCAQIGQFGANNEG
jgi:hypothetical protein